jgi:UDP-N-acetylglucosamine acyltransferase
MIGGMSGVENDVIPYGLVKGDRAHLAGLNLVGLERRGFGRNDVRSLRSAYRMLFASEGTMAERLDEVARLYGKEEHIRSVIEFIRSRSSRALCQPQNSEG